MSNQDTPGRKDRFAKRYSMAEYNFSIVLNIAIVLLVCLNLFPTPDYSMFPEGYGLMWVCYGIIAVESFLITRYLRESVSVKGVIGTVKSAMSRSNLMQRVFIGSLVALFVYTQYTGEFSSDLGIMLLLVGLLLNNIQRILGEVAVSEVEVTEPETTENSLALSAEDISEMDDSDWNRME